MRTIKKKSLKVRCPVCKSLVEIEPSELKKAQIDDYMNNVYWRTRTFKAFICPECDRAIYHRWFGWREWEKGYIRY